MIKNKDKIIKILTIIKPSFKNPNFPSVNKKKVVIKQDNNTDVLKLIFNLE